MISEKIETDYSVLWKEDLYTDIVFATFSPQLNITIDTAQDLVKRRVEFAHNQPHYVVIDVTNIKSTTKDAREYMSSPEGGLKNVMAGTFISNNVVTTVIVNIYLKLTNPPIPSKFFTNKEDAVAWLTKIKNTSNQV
jgi:hypothetical protein